MNRRQFLKASTAAAAAGVLGIAADATLIEPNDPELVKLELVLPRLPEAFDGFRIVQLSDFHYDSHFSIVPIRKAVSITNGIVPDLIVLTGDFVTRPMLPSSPLIGDMKPELAAPACAQLLKDLTSPFGSFAVLGNHDVACCAPMVVESLQNNNIRALRNDSFPLERNGARIWICGIDDALEGRPNLGRVLHNVPANEPALLLAHEPDFADLAKRFPFDLQLSGHSHGGQIRIPLLGPPYLPPLGRKFPMGLYQLRALQLYTNCGIGTIRVPVRWNCPPEITLLTLRSTAKRSHVERVLPDLGR